MVRLLLLAMVVISTTACDKRDSAGQRALDQLAELQKKKAAQAEAKRDENKLVPLPVAVDVVKLDPPYNDDGSTRLTPDAACPEGFWALFGLEAPGATPEEKKTNEANRKTIAEGLKRSQFMVKLRVGSGVALKPFDPPKGLFTVEVQGMVDCTDARGHIAIAWSEPKPTSRAPGELAQWYWDAPPVIFTLPMKSMLEAKAFETENRIGLTARIVFTLGKAELDKRPTKVPKVSTSAGSDEKIEYGGGTEDWGAGRLVRAELVGIRVAVDRDRKQLFDLRGSK